VGEVQAAVVPPSIVCNAASCLNLFFTLPRRAILPLVCLHPRAPPPTRNVRYGNTAAMQLKKWRASQSEDLISDCIGSDEDAAADGGIVDARRAVLPTRAYLFIRLELLPVAASQGCTPGGWTFVASPIAMRRLQRPPCLPPTVGAPPGPPATTLPRMAVTQNLGANESAAPVTRKMEATAVTPAIVLEARTVGGAGGVGTRTRLPVSPQWGGRRAWASAARERQALQAQVVHGCRGGADRHVAGASGQTRGWCGSGCGVSASRIGAEVRGCAGGFPFAPPPPAAAAAARSAEVGGGVRAACRPGRTAATCR